MKRLQTFDSIYFKGKSHFEEDGTQNYLVFQPMYRYFKRVAGVGSCNLKEVLVWESKELRTWFGTKTRVGFKGSCLKPDKITYDHRKMSNIYIIYEINKNFNIGSYPTLKNWSFAAVILTKNTGINKCKYFGYGIGFDGHGCFSHHSGGTGRNVIIFEVDMSSSTKIDNRKKDILIFDEGPTQGLEHALSAEKMYSINFSENNKNILFGLVL